MPQLQIDEQRLTQRLEEISNYESWISSYSMDLNSFPHQSPDVYLWLFTKDSPETYGLFRNWYTRFLTRQAGMDFGLQELFGLVEAAQKRNASAVRELLEYSAGQHVLDRFIVQRANAFGVARLRPMIKGDDALVRLMLIAIANYFEVEVSYWLLGAFGKIVMEGHFDANPLDECPGEYLSKSEMIRRTRRYIKGMPVEQVLDTLYPSTKVRNMIQHNQYEILPRNELVRHIDATIELTFAEVEELFAYFEQWFLTVINVMGLAEQDYEPHEMSFCGVVGTGHELEPATLHIYQLLPFFDFASSHLWKEGTSLDMQAYPERVEIKIGNKDIHKVLRSDFSDSWLARVRDCGELNVNPTPVVPSVFTNAPKLSFESGEYDVLAGGRQLVMSVVVSGV